MTGNATTTGAYFIGDHLTIGSGTATTTYGPDYLTSQNEYTLQTTAGNLILTSASLLDINAGANLDLDVTGNGTIDTTGTLTIASTGTSAWTITSGDLNVTTAVSGDINVTAADNMSLTYGNTFLLTDGTPRLEIDSSGNIILGDTSASTTLDITIMILMPPIIIL